MKACICYQGSYSVVFKRLRVKLGQTSAIEIKHQHKMKKMLNENFKGNIEIQQINLLKNSNKNNT